MDEIPTLLPKLRRLLRSRGRTRDDTEDLIQEAFLRLQLYCRDRTVRKTEAFLVRTALNLSADHVRQERCITIEQGVLETLPLIDPRPTPDAVYEGEERLMHWKQGLCTLSPRQREVFLLNRMDGYSFTQIADRLGISLSMVEKHAAKAVLYLTEWMGRES